MKHGRYGCTDYECQRAETARNSGSPVESDDTPPVEAPAGTTGVYDNGGVMPSGEAVIVNLHEGESVIRDEESW